MREKQILPNRRESLRNGLQAGLTALALVLTVTVSAPALAQDDEIATTGENQDGGMAAIADNMEAMVSMLNENVTVMDGAIADGMHAMQNAPEILNELLASVEQINDSIAEDSETWQDLNALINEWEEHSERTRSRAAEAQDSTFQEISAMWQERVVDAVRLRDDISEQRARSRSLINDLDLRRDVVEELIMLGASDRVLESMQAVRDSLVAVNDDMSSMLQQAQNLDSSVAN